MFNLYDVFDRSLEDLLLKAFGKKYKVPCRIWAAIERIRLARIFVADFQLILKVSTPVHFDVVSELV